MMSASKAALPMVRLPIRRSHGLLAALLLLVSCSVSFASSSAGAVAVPSSVSSPDVWSEDQGAGQNPALQLIGYVKTSVVRTIDGVGLMWKNHGRCNDIRSKQKQHREMLRAVWEGEGLSNQEIKGRLKGVNGGITYDEYAFLIKGKEDRGKLTQLVFLSWGAPRFLPYALMFYPEMLPSAFAPQAKAGDESKIDSMSRKRSHAVIRTLLSIENDAKVVPALAKLNIFGRKQQQRAMEQMQRIGQEAASLFVTPVRNQYEGAELVFKTLERSIYSFEEPDAKTTRLVGVPNAIIKGLAQTMDGGSPLDSVLPHFITRGKVLNHIKKVTESDEFLISESVPLDTLGKQRLLEACKDRMIAENGRSDDEMRESLALWLDQVVVNPTERVLETGEFYNGNLARAAMMCYQSLQAAKDERSASYLPRLLFQGSAASMNSAKGGKEGSSKTGRFFSGSNK